MVDDVLAQKTPHLMVDAVEPVVGEILGKDEQNGCVGMGSGIAATMRPKCDRECGQRAANSGLRVRAPPSVPTRTTEQPSWPR
jgi:hypothetical protein